MKISIRYISAFLIAVGILFMIIGYGLMVTSDYEISTSDEIEFDYTDCIPPDGTDSPKSCRDVIRETNASNCDTCLTSFNVTRTLVGQVIVYYELTNYNQTSPEYVNSRDDNQLNGILSAVPSENCEPYRYIAEKPIVPCGLIAYTMFNDTFELELSVNPEVYQNVPIIEYGMLSDSDKIGFKNPEKWDSFAFRRPDTWEKSITILDEVHPDNNGFQNERFIGWMRTDWKRKPYGRLSRYGTYKNGLPMGQYRLTINYKRYNHYDGPRKLIFVATATTVVNGPFQSGAVLLPIGFLIVFIVAALIYGPRILEVLHTKYDEIRASRANGAAAANPPKPTARTQPATPLLKPPRTNANENLNSAL